MLFKLLNAYGVPANGGTGHWSLPTYHDGQWEPGEWLEVKGEIVPCENGLHLCCAEYLSRWVAPCCYVAEFAPGTEVLDWGDKLVGRKARLLYPIKAWNDRTLRIFATRCVRRVWHLLCSENSKEAVRVARRYADGEATYEELATARDAAFCAPSGAPHDAAWATARVTTNVAVMTASAAVCSVAHIHDVEKAWQTRHLLWMMGLRNS